MFKKINSIIGRLIDNQKPNKKREEIEKAWEKQINKKTQQNATIVGFEKNTLIIKAANPTWRMELSLTANEIKKKLTNKQTQK
jgi:hypothetical protein